MSAINSNSQTQMRILQRHPKETPHWLQMLIGHSNLWPLPLFIIAKNTFTAAEMHSLVPEMVRTLATKDPHKIFYALINPENFSTPSTHNDHIYILQQYEYSDKISLEDITPNRKSAWSIDCRGMPEGAAADVKVTEKAPRTCDPLLIDPISISHRQGIGWNILAFVRT